jgi:hypothetical protein
LPEYPFNEYVDSAFETVRRLAQNLGLQNFQFTTATVKRSPTGQYFMPNSTSPFSFAGYNFSYVKRKNP